MLSHRWAAEHIHGLPLTAELQVDHECGNTLCQHHLAVVAPTLNRELQWIRVQVGLDEPPQPYEVGDDIPFYIEPDWLKAAVR